MFNIRGTISEVTLPYELINTTTNYILSKDIRLIIIILYVLCSVISINEVITPMSVKPN